MTGRRWVVIITLIVLDCAALAALAGLAATYRPGDRTVAQFVFDRLEDKEPVSTPMAPTSTVIPTVPTRTALPTAPASTGTRSPTAQTPKPTAVASSTKPTVSPAATSTPSRAATPSPTLLPSRTATPSAAPALRPTAMPGPVTLVSTLLNPFANEAYRRRVERARLDPDYTRRVDQKLSQGRINFLLYGYGETHEPPVAVDVIIGSLTILSYDARTGRVDIVSLTHDTRAPEIERFLAQRGQPSKPMKIDQAYSVGGFDLMRRTVEDATGLSIDFQIAFKDSLLLNLVDGVLSGIVIDNPADFKVQPFYLDGRLFDEGRFGKGRQGLNGTQTLQYIKALTARHDPSLERNVRKVIVLRALLDGANQRCHDRDFWLRASSFLV